MAVPYPNCQVDLWNGPTPAPGVPPNNNFNDAATLRPYYPIATPQLPINGFPLIYRILLAPIVFDAPVRQISSGVFLANIYYRFSFGNDPWNLNQVFQVIAMAPHMRAGHNEYWYIYSYYWGPQP